MRQRHVDSAAWRSVFDCVIKQVEEHLSQQVLVAALQRLLCWRDFNRDVFSTGQHPRSPDGFSHEFFKIEITLLKRALSGIRAGV